MHSPITKGKTMNVYELLCEDYSGLGGPMGTEKTYPIFNKLYSTTKKAKEAAGKDHARRGGKDGEPIRWRKVGGNLYSGDLRSHGYTIAKKKVL